MRWLLTVSLLAACGEGGTTTEVEEASVDLCELGQERYERAVHALHDASPSCARDEECVRVATDVDCNGFALSLCGEVVHRDVAARWSASEVCAPLNAYPAATTKCDVTAKCINDVPACVQGQCAARRPDAGSSLGGS